MRLPFTIPARVRLVAMEMCKAALAVDEDTVLARIQEGALPWAFDLSAGRRVVTEPRVWSECLANPDKARAAGWVQVLGDILGERATEWRGAELAIRFNCGPQTLRRLVAAGDLRGSQRGHTLWIEAASVGAFLSRRRMQ